jgi:hypothetical protein
MLSVTRFPGRRILAAAGLTSAVLLAVAACGGGSSTPAGMGGTSTGMQHTAPAGPSAMASMPGMSGMASGDGLSAEASGVTFAPTATALPANQPSAFRFQIRDASGMPVTAFQPDQTKLMHLYLIRSDLTGFQHVHPTMAPDGTWTANLAGMPPGSYRTYTSFITQVAGKDTPLVLSQPVNVAGTANTTALPPASMTTTVDGYTLTISGDKPMAGMTHVLSVTIVKDGRPVTDLQPYLDTYAHLTAFHAGDLAFAHLHPQGTVNGDHGGPTLTFEAELPKPGSWRLFLQFQTAGTLHTAAITLAVG